MISFTHNGPQFKAALMRGVARSPEARRAALLAITKAVGVQIMVRSPVDTGRFKRAEAQALNQAGAGPFAVANVVLARSKYADRIEKRLRNQLRFWTRIKDRMVRKGLVYTKGIGKERRGRGRPTKAYRDVCKRVERAQEYLDQYLASGGTGPAIGVEVWQRWKEAQRRKDKNVDNVLTRAYNKEYGGAGRFIDTPGQSVVQLVNKEPHAKIVEYKKAVRAASIRAAGGGAVKRASQKYTKEIAAAAGLAVKI